jgi:ribosomal protein S18 acetylase RimI-like enzyme
MCEIIIRTAGEQDFDALDKLYYDFHQYHVREIPDRLQDLGKIENQDWSRLHHALRDIFANKDAIIFLAEDSGLLIGLVEVYFRQDDEANSLIVPHKYAHLQSLMVSEPYRKSGIGKKLMDVAQQWAREKGATEMRLDVWEFNQGTIQFYEKMGFHTLKRTLVTDL